jgi:hypothetical protein
MPRLEGCETDKTDAQERFPTDPPLAREKESLSSMLQIPHPVCGSGQEGCCHPSIFARSPGRQQGAVKAESVDCRCDLLQIGKIESAACFARTEIAAVSVGRNKPK